MTTFLLLIYALVFMALGYEIRDYILYVKKVNNITDRIAEEDDLRAEKFLKEYNEEENIEKPERSQK